MKKSELTKFMWSKECQEGFDALKQALTTAPVLAYPDYNQSFILKTDGVWEQSCHKRAKTEKFALLHMQTDFFDHPKDPCVTIVLQKSNSWHLNGQCVNNLRTIYWVRSLQFLLTTTLWCMFKKSKLGAAQIRWLSELALYNFDIVYQTGHSNLITDTLSGRPEVEG